MGNETRENKNPSVGSIYINTKKGTDTATEEKVKKAIEWLKSIGVFLNISLKLEGDSDYTKFAAFFDTMNKKPNAAHMRIKLSGVAESAPAAPKKESNDDLPF